MSSHSSIVGGSSAGRLLQCPGSYRTTLALPPSAEVSSPYAEEGTFAHAVMADIMTNRREEEKAGLLCSHARQMDFARALIGEHFHDRALQREHLDSMIEPALDALADLEALYGSGFAVVGVEERVRFPGVPGAFGTVDLLLRSPRHVLCVDWKFGQGVGIKAVYQEDAGDLVNPQLMFYATAAYHTLRRQFTGRKLAVAIIQPRSATPLTHTPVQRRELNMFIEDMHAAVQAALGREPPIKKGESCRFAACKSICKLWTGPLLDLSMLKPEPPREFTVVPKMPPTAYGLYLAKAKALADAAALFKSTLDEQLHAYLSAGGVVPGWRLKDKKKQRKWIDTDVVATELTKLGFTEEEIWQEKLQTFESTDATAKRRGVKIPDHLRLAPPSTETTIAPTDDPAPVVEPIVLIEQFAESLKQLRKTNTWLTAQDVISAPANVNTKGK